MAAESSSKMRGFGLKNSNCNLEVIPNPNSNPMSVGFEMGSYFASSSGFIPGLLQPLNSSSTTTFLDYSGLKHDTGLAVDWSMDEQLKLEEGLAKYADEPNIMRYVKIATTLRDKTVRDVALRCRWMTRKRKKLEEYNFGKKMQSRKDKLVELNSKTNIPLAHSQKMGSYPLLMHHMDQNGPFPFEVLGISGTTRHLLEQNSQAFGQITANLSTFKDNLELFCHTRNNIIAILNDMKNMPGLMSQMPPLPVHIDEDLANGILPHTIQSMMLGLPVGIQLKQEPRC
ncbi:uncharacterized protein LOC123216533 isoform X2 [Mangifera indica]|uniref:uncharacterized protein LOC123216533 isoform X2 n=1 Tax=Mangifera indica TaxID=29780 RepID=UPI001CFBF1D5|nr:uncharacterized protein LOC123216533 isoform X2 [Mangifera indica]